MMHSTSIHRPAGHWPKEQAAGVVTLDFDARHRRRIRLTTDEGEDILLEFPKAVAMADGDALQLDDGRLLMVQAAPEVVVEVRHRDPHQLMRIAWHLGTGHVLTKSRNAAGAMGAVVVMEAMPQGLGADLTAGQAPSQPEGGVYSGNGNSPGKRGDHDVGGPVPFPAADGGALAT